MEHSAIGSATSLFIRPSVDQKGIGVFIVATRFFAQQPLPSGMPGPSARLHSGTGGVLVASRIIFSDIRPHGKPGGLPGCPTVTGALAVPELHRVFAGVAGNYEVAAVDTEAMKVATRIPAGQFPDGLAHSPETGKVVVSDERSGKETVIDARTNRRLFRLLRAFLRTPTRR